MRIGLDAYVAFNGKTGVAHYSRNLINSLAELYPDAELVLFTDRATELFQPAFPNIHVHEINKQGILFDEWLANKRLTEAVELEKIDIFHGLDHGLPVGIEKLAIKKVVTIHDLFFETHPFFYDNRDVSYYRLIAPEACEKADTIVAISQFTAEDVISCYNTDLQKTEVCYQSCNPAFFLPVTKEKQIELRKTFDLPERFWLYVGSVIERKNLLKICEGIKIIKEKSTIPLIVIGEGKEYLQKVQDYLRLNNLTHRVHFLSYTRAARESLLFQQAKDVPAFYQMATALLYPSLLEGFGIPLVEAMASGLPVLTSNTGSLPETGGDAAYYVSPQSAEEIAEGLLKLSSDEGLRLSMIEKGRQRVKNFTPQKCASRVMELYLRFYD